MGFVGRAAAAIGWEAAKQTVTYASAAVSGYTGMKVMTTTVDAFSEGGRKFAGSVGEVVGRVIGKAVAGEGLESTSKQVSAFGDGMRTVGLTLIDLASKGSTSETKTEEKVGTANEVKKAETDYVGNAIKVAKVAGVVLGGVAIATGLVPAAGIGLVAAASHALPRIAEAIVSAPKKSDKPVESFEDIMVAGAKAVVKESAAVIIGNVVRYEFVKNIYDARCAEAVSIGQKVGSYLPNFMQSTVAKTAEMVGKIDAGRLAFNEETIKGAQKAGESAEQVVKTGFDLADHVVSQQISSPAVSNWDYARKVAWIGAGVASGVAVCAIAPQIAPIIAMTSALSVADKVAAWAKNRLNPPQEAKTDEDVALKNVGNEELAKAETPILAESKKIPAELTQIQTPLSIELPKFTSLEAAPAA